MRSEFIVPHFIAPIFVLMIVCTCGPAQAMTPGADKNAWDPSVIPRLTRAQVRALKAAKCDVVSYRNQESSNYTPNTSGKPDDMEELMLARGQFAKAGQQDLIALCQSSGKGPEFFFVVWGGPAHCDSTLMLSSVSRFWKTRDATLDYYGSQLRVLHPADVRDLLTRAAGEPAHGESEMGENETWYLKQGQRPHFNHDAFALYGNYSVAYCCDGTNWIPLYDSYSTEID